MTRYNNFMKDKNDQEPLGFFRDVKKTMFSAICEMKNKQIKNGRRFSSETVYLRNVILNIILDIFLKNRMLALKSTKPQ